MPTLLDSIRRKTPTSVAEKVAAAEALLREARQEASASGLPKAHREELAGTLSNAIDVVGRASKKVAVVMALGIASGLAPHIEASDPPAWQLAVYEMDACLRKASPRIAAIDPHQFIAVARGQKWRARGHAVAAAYQATDGRKFTLIREATLLNELSKVPDDREFLHDLLTHEYAHHLGHDGHGKKFEAEQARLKAETGVCR